MNALSTIDNAGRSPSFSFATYSHGMPVSVLQFSLCLYYVGEFLTVVQKLKMSCDTWQRILMYIHFKYLQDIIIIIIILSGIYNPL